MHIHAYTCRSHARLDGTREISHLFASKRGFTEFSIAHNHLQIMRTIPFELMKDQLTTCTTMHSSNDSIYLFMYLNAYSCLINILPYIQLNSLSACITISFIHIQSIQTI
jgi:hypothetical protein